VFAERVQVEVAVVLVRPIVVGLDLSAFLFSSKHDDDANILLPHDLPEILRVVSDFVGGRLIQKILP
jgi:hypothetical protein